MSVIFLVFFWIFCVEMGECFVGVCPCFVRQSRPVDDEERARRVQSRTIDRTIEVDRQRQRRTVKILLLGSGESGKSTFMKQMRIIHGKVWCAFIWLILIYARAWSFVTNGNLRDFLMDVISTFFCSVRYPAYLFCPHSSVLQFFGKVISAVKIRDNNRLLICCEFLP